MALSSRAFLLSGVAARSWGAQQQAALFAFSSMDASSPSRNMATLKEVKARIRSVKSIQKITKSMKLVATTRLKKAQETFEKNRPSLIKLEEIMMDVKADAGITEPTEGKRHQVVCLTTERGLCGSVNSSVAKVVKKIAEKTHAAKEDEPTTFTLLGNKAIQSLQRDCGDRVGWSAKALGGRSGPQFADVLPVAERLVTLEFDRGTFVRNSFVNLLTFQTNEVPMITRNQFLNLDPSSFEFDSGVKEDTLKNLHEWYTAVSLFSYLSETHCIEIGQRMTSMDNATKNAGELIKKLTMAYNRRRQANITTEITEIVSGAAAVEEDM